MREVDTAALAEALKCPPAFVLRLARIGILKPVGTRRVHRLGAPAKTFDLDASKAAWREALDAGRVVFDRDRYRVRKS